MILFKVEGGLNIGMGHIYSSIAIANELKKKGIKSEFLMECHNKEYEQGEIEVKKEGYNINYVENKKIKEFVLKNKPKIIFMDSYPLKIEILNELNKIQDLKIIITSYLEDIPNKIGFNYLINWFIGLNENNKEEYSLGPKFFPIRKEFLLLHKKGKIFGEGKILLTIGGGKDKYNILPKISKELTKIANIKKVYILIGNNNDENYKKEFLKLPKKFKVLNTTDNLHNLMYEVDLAITSAGNTSYELACIGTPAIYTCIVPHQLKTAEIWHKEGIGINLGYVPKIPMEKLYKIVNDLFSNKDLLRKMSKKGKEKVDGNGLDRIINIILKNYN